MELLYWDPTEPTHLSNIEVYVFQYVCHKLGIKQHVLKISKCYTAVVRQGDNVNGTRVYVPVNMGLYGSENFKTLPLPQL